MRTAIETARAIAQGMDIRNESVKISRCQLSTKAIRDIARRDVVDFYFIAALSSALLEEGWCFFQVSDSNYGLIRRESVEGFRKMSGIMLSNLVTQREAP